VQSRLESQLKVAFQGERGAFSEEAARRLLGADIQVVPKISFEELFESVGRVEVDCAVVPIENSLAGSVHKNYDLLLEHQLTIIGEATVRIVHNLIAPPGVALEAVRRVYSHPVALAQCERFLRAHPNLQPVAAYDTAGSVKMVMERRLGDEAAIAGRSAAAAYGAEIIAPAIESHEQNFTRFLLMSRPDRAASIRTVGQSPDRKTSIVFRLSNKPGALFKALAVFALRDIDLTKIESRPLEGRPWEYSFYLDLLGDREEPRVERAISHLGEITEELRLLGSYPQSEPV
jgi:prephenate dehydratase